MKEKLTDNPLPSIQLIDIHLPSSQEFPPHYHTTKALPPRLLPNLKEIFDAAKPAFCDILKALKPDLVIYDFLQPWAPKAATEESIKSILFLTCGASSVCAFIHASHNPINDLPFPAMVSCLETTGDNLIQFMSRNKERVTECIRRSSGFVLIKTSKEIEAKYLEYLSLVAGKEFVPVGTLVDKDDDVVVDASIMEWMEKKDPSSVVFVSFGSEYFLSKEEIEEIAYGLELSKVNFIWVIRSHGEQKTTTLYEALPKGFHERVGDRGMVVESWAPQMKILMHPSVGGFMSHCGWSSTLEAAVLGVPIIAMPMKLDQPFNAKVAVENGVGVEVKKRNGEFRRDEIETVVKEVIVMQKESKMIRQSVKHLSERIRENGDKEIDLVVNKLADLLERHD